MKEHKGAHAFSSNHHTVVTIGTFDGVHIGHQKIIERLVNTARAGNLESAILTFFPHPRMVLQKDADIKLINTIEERKGILEKSGIDHLIIHPFTQQFSRLSAREFVRDFLVQKLKAKKIIIGYDHRFGRNRTADINDLREFGKEYDFEVEEISKQDIEDVAVSSTKIRKALLE
ncbi:riboflavin biosynthesis protein RibF, partial [Salinimicrobium sp. CDJ15-91]|nr:riboflavin biosynthesis protein RibF [Salinimicrobium oceani]